MFFNTMVEPNMRSVSQNSEVEVFVSLNFNNDFPLELNTNHGVLGSSGDSANWHSDDSD